MQLSLSLNTSLTQTLTPQQVQYLKLLQLTNLQLEQYLQQEIEANPMLEETQEQDIEQRDTEIQPTPEEPAPMSLAPEESEPYDEVGDIPYEAPSMDDFDPNDATNPDDNTWQDYIEDDDYRSPRSTDGDNDDPFPMRSVVSFVEELLEQLALQDLSEEERLLGEAILWNVESSGYLGRPLEDIVEEANDTIRERNLGLLRKAAALLPSMPPAPAMPTAYTNNAEMYSSEEYSMDVYDYGTEPHASYGHDEHGIDAESALRAFAQVHNIHLLEPVSLPQAERLLRRIQLLEPAGIGARNLQECLLAQLNALPRLNAAQKLAREILAKCYDAFRMKHFDVMMRTLRVSESYLREALDIIRGLNPKPGGGDSSMGTHTVIPDFFIEYDEEKDDFLVLLNDSRLPALSINREYEKVRREARRNKFNKDTREWLRKKYDDAKFLIQAMNQRRDTMRKVITAIVHRQRDFFRHGENYLKPLIYRDIADDTGLDISTVCRVVNGKYAQTEYGVFELRYFFSESLESDEGEEISTKVIKNKLKELIESEPKNKPHSDDKLAREMKKLGYNVARRTVAKYREQLRIPVARLRKEL